MLNSCAFCFFAYVTVQVTDRAEGKGVTLHSTECISNATHLDFCIKITSPLGEYETVARTFFFPTLKSFFLAHYLVKFVKLTESSCRIENRNSAPIFGPRNSGIPNIVIFMSEPRNPRVGTMDGTPSPPCLLLSVLKVTSGFIPSLLPASSLLSLSAYPPRKTLDTSAVREKRKARLPTSSWPKRSW
jgi:hypothetical protein